MEYGVNVFSRFVFFVDLWVGQRYLWDPADKDCKREHVVQPCVLSRCGLVVRRLAGKQKDLGSIRFGSRFPSLQKLWFMDAVL